MTNDKTESTWMKMGGELSITHISGWPLEKPIRLKAGDRLQVNGVEVLGPETKLVLTKKKKR